MRHSLDEQAWNRMTKQITAGMRELHLQHPKATLHVIEHELDTRWARILEALALAVRAAADR